MPSTIATNMPCNAVWNNRQEMIAGAKVFMRLPENLRINVLEQSVPDLVVDFYMAAPKYEEPFFMSSSPLAHLGNQVDRLNYTKILLRNTVLHIWSVKDLQDLHRWLATIDFTPLGLGNLNDGFGGVRHLSFTDLLNLSDARLPIPRDEYNSDGTTPTDVWKFASGFWTIYSDKPVWNDCIALTRLCKDLHTLNLRVELSGNLMQRLHKHDNMAAVLRVADVEADSAEEHSDDCGALQIVRLLDLQGLRVLRVLFYTWNYESAKVSEEKLLMITHWLEDGFHSRRQKIKVEVDLKHFCDTMYL
jgi:hypothetical protein